MAKRIVFFTFGSLGDLHPFLGIGLALKTRGYAVTIATGEHYRPKITATGLDFAAVRPDMPDPSVKPELMSYFMHPSKGPKRLFSEFIFPPLKDSYTDSLAAASGASLLVSHPLTFSTRIISEKTGTPWAAVNLQPMGFFSIYDPPVMAPAPWLNHFRRLGPSFHTVLFALFRQITKPWLKPWHELRKELNLPHSTSDPIYEGQFSPYLNLALYSSLFASPQPDWPPHTITTGFPFYDEDGNEDLSLPVLNFLDQGEPPIVFTRGSAAVHDANDFFEVSAAAAERLNTRAVFLIGKASRNKVPRLPPTMITTDYEPFSKLLPRAAINVHQCGVGTSGQALAAGRPMLLVPHAFDQPDNAYRLSKLGVGITIKRGSYQVDEVTKKLKRLLSEPGFSENALSAAKIIQAENGVETATQALASLAGPT